MSESKVLGIILAVTAALVAAVAFAGDVQVGSLTQLSDGGVVALSISPRVKYTMQCTIPSCYKTGGSSITYASCATDYVLPLVGSKYERAFDSALNSKVTAWALDGGNPNCQVYQVTTNP